MRGGIIAGMPELITVPLAHKFPASEAARLGATERRDYQPGEGITLPRASAEMLAGAAMLQVDPRDREAVAALLRDAPVSGGAREGTPAQVPPAQTAPASAPAAVSTPQPAAVPPPALATPSPVTPATPQPQLEPDAAPPAVLQVPRS